ncbi:MAG: hypothetical protein ACOX25_03040 [Caldicoprobacterales bacterium]
MPHSRSRKAWKRSPPFSKKEFYGGAGFKSDNGEFSAWYAEDGIHLAKGRSSRYARLHRLSLGSLQPSVSVN